MTSALMKTDPAGLPALPSVLGDKRYSCQTGGKVSRASKVLTKAAQKIEAARRLYDEGVGGRTEYGRHRGPIRAAVPNLDRSPLTPRNVPYFTVRGSDFAMPEIARQIMSKYAEDRGDGILRLYRFPVVFASDSLLDVMPHKLEAYGSGSIEFWSDFGRRERALPRDLSRRCASQPGRAIWLFRGANASCARPTKAVRSGELSGVPEPPMQRQSRIIFIIRHHPCRPRTADQ
ncbi:MAG: hypothetical protein IPI02_18655 [Sterolibacteriaceae bacterium]|nr:hypothetical protein [Sterolibacteriaceae bacterium]